MKYSFFNSAGEVIMPEYAQNLPTDISDVQVDTKQRDSSFLMTGHHCHSCYEIYYVHSGGCRFLVEDHFYDLRAGDLVLIPPLVLHYTSYNFGTCIRTVILFRGEDITEDTLHCLHASGKMLPDAGLFRVPPAAVDQLDNCIKQMTTEDRIADGYSALLRKAYLQSLLLLCCRVCDFPTDGPEEIKTEDQQILRAARFINENYMNPITTEDVARAVSFSPNYLSRRFRLEAGIGLHEYIVFVRLHHAAHELVTTSDSITVIALRCGFSNSNYFKDSFKKKYGVTPRSYRNMR